MRLPERLRLDGENQGSGTFSRDLMKTPPDRTLGSGARAQVPRGGQHVCLHLAGAERRPHPLPRRPCWARQQGRCHHCSLHGVFPK